MDETGKVINLRSAQTVCAAESGVGGHIVKKTERAAQLWAVLALAARTHQVVSYKMLEQLTGIARHGLGPLLGPIQEYCRRRRLPPLTAIVVKEDTGLPGEGFSGADVPDMLAAQARVYVFDWLSQGAPSPEDFEP